MFCEKCGAQMIETARFCPKCGHERSMVETPRNNVREDNDVRFQLKPRFHLAYKLLTNMLQGFGFLLLIVILVLDPKELEHLGIDYSLIWIIAIIITVIYIVVKTVLEKMQYNDLEYNFYNAKVEYKDGFLNKEEKQLKYKSIREVVMTQNVLERMCGIGTIRIFTSATSGSYKGNNHAGMQGRNGIYIHCVENVQDQYRTIKKIIDEGTSEGN